MRFLSLLAIASIAFCVSMCTPSPSNSVTPTTNTPVGNCYDGIKNGTEQGIDCGGSCPNSCTGKITISLDGGTSYSCETAKFTISPNSTLNANSLQLSNVTFNNRTITMTLFAYAPKTIPSHPVTNTYALNGSLNSNYFVYMVGVTNTATGGISGTGGAGYTGTGSMTITSVDRTNQTFSGTFHFALPGGPAGNPQTLQANGTITNLKYIIQ